MQFEPIDQVPSGLLHKASLQILSPLRASILYHSPAYDTYTETDTDTQTHKTHNGTQRERELKTEIEGGGNKKRQTESKIARGYCTSERQEMKWVRSGLKRQVGHCRSTAILDKSCFIWGVEWSQTVSMWGLSVSVLTWGTMKRPGRSAPCWKSNKSKQQSGVLVLLTWALERTRSYQNIRINS